MTSNNSLGPSCKALPFAFGGPVCTAVLKRDPADFIVIEHLPFEADGEGPHWLLELEKTDLNTLDMLDAVSRSLKVSRKAIGYSGLKDRFAITRQFVTLPAQGLAQEDLAAASGEGWKVLGVRAHRRKLRVGSHRENGFEITLQDVSGDVLTREALERRLTRIGLQGVPNYFGPQRFGHDGANLRKAGQLFTQSRKLPRQQHRFAVSAARSFVFNTVVARRVELGNWNQLVPGEAVNLHGSSSWFGYDRLKETDQARFDALDLHPSGPMWGLGELASADEVRRIELEAVASFDVMTKGLEGLGLKQERRALRLPVSKLEWSFNDASSLTLRFRLPKGGFATSVLRELVTADGLLLTNRGIETNEGE
ncbi:MAG: tRNA pseudouridine(13) synthase TruD [Gammaproteobacteria bacterium]